jgi:hypothetical protein
VICKPKCTFRWPPTRRLFGHLLGPLLRYTYCQRRSPASRRFHWRGFNWHVELFLHIKLLNPAVQSHIPEGLDPRLIRCFDVLQTVYRHCSFGQQSVIVMFYKLRTATVQSVMHNSATTSQPDCPNHIIFRNLLLR